MNRHRAHLFFYASLVGMVFAFQPLQCFSQTAAGWNEEKQSNSTPGTITSYNSAEGTFFALRELTRQVQPSVVEILNENQTVVLGTLVSADGLMITKASELPRQSNLKCQTFNGDPCEAKIIATVQHNDLALLSVVSNLGAELPQPIKFSRQGNSTPIPAGSFVIGTLGEDTTPRLGTISIDQLKSWSPIGPTECTDCVEVGIKAMVVSTIERDQAGLARVQSETIITRVEPRSAAEDAGVLIGDQLVSINQAEISNQWQMKNFVDSLPKGASLTFEVKREGNRLSLKSELPKYSRYLFHDRWGGGPFSRRRFGFSTPILHDIPVAPEECGSPLVNLNGEVVGINIARSLRTTTLAIPIGEVKSLLRAVRPAAKLVFRD